MQELKYKKANGKFNRFITAKQIAIIFIFIDI